MMPLRRALMLLFVILLVAGTGMFVFLPELLCLRSVTCEIYGPKAGFVR